MTIVFNNPHGSPVRVAREDVVVVDKTAEGIVYAANDPTPGDTMMTTVMSEETVDDPMGMEQEMEDMLRYDNGVIEELTTTNRDGDTRVHIFTADIWCERFTPERWQSFGLTAMALNDRAQYEIACAHDKHKQLYGTDQFNSEVQT